MKIITKFLVAAAISVALFTACKNNTDNGDSTSNQKEHFNFSDIQEKFATKASKPVSENNPIANLKFTADPAVLVYQDTVYVYGTNDSEEFNSTLGKTDNSYSKISTLNVYSSKDLVNWTYEGEIPVGKKQNPLGAASWAANSWAPAVCSKQINGKDKFFIYFADNASGIGVLSADSPTGPFTDPLGKPLITRSTPNTSSVEWLFDPAVFIDDDGTGYLCYGGGVPAGKDKNPMTSRIVKLGEDMISLDGTPVTIDAPFIFEDSGLNKINDKYVYSYCTNWADRKNYPGSDPAAVIAYMTSDNPLGPYEYKGYFLKNMWDYYGAGGNNHHWIFSLKDKWYVAYHAATVEQQLEVEKGGYRSLFISELKINSDGSIPVQESTNINKAGVSPVCSFDPYNLVSGATLHSSKNLIITEDKTAIPAKNGAYLCIKNVNFSKGASEILINAGAKSGEGKLTVKLGDARKGTVIAEIPVTEAGSITEEVKLPSNISGNKNLFIVFTGNVELESWQIR